MKELLITSFLQVMATESCVFLRRVRRAPVRGKIGQAEPSRIMP